MHIGQDGGAGRALDISSTHARLTACRSALPHRLDALHRLQGLRGRVQGMERRAARRLRVDRPLVRQHARARALDVAAREVRRADARAGRRRQCRRSDLVGVLVRRLQALRACRLPRGMSDRLDRAHRVRRRLRAARHLQRLRLLRRRLPVRRGRPAARRRPRVQVHVLLRPAEGGLEPACAKACPTESILFGDLDELRVRARRTRRASCTRAA